MSGASSRNDPLLVDVEGHCECLLGNEAIVRGALEAGVAFASGYPGTPSSEITDAFSRIAAGRSVVFEYSVNEKIALEVAFAASLAGARSLCAMKHLGLTYAGDPLTTIPYVGTVAGLVIVSAGDPSCHTSPNEQDQRYLGPMLHLPMLDPSTPEEALVMTRMAFDLSEESRLPVVLRPTTRVCHQRSAVRYGRLREPRVAGFVRDTSRFVPVPPNARRMRQEIEQRLEVAREVLGRAGFVRRTGRGRLGIVASGAPAATCAAVIAEGGFADAVSLLAVGVVHPLPEKELAAFLEEVDRVLVVEELSPFLEDALHAVAGRRHLGVEILGKRTGHFPVPFEYDPDIIARALHAAFGLGHAPIAPAKAAPVPSRPPVLCAGCGHRAAYFAARSALGQGALFFNDIGCYTLGHGAPLDSVDALLCMGAGISLAAGVSRATGQRTVGFVGDATFFHSGMPALLDAIKERASMIAVILDNQVTAMTGFQDSPSMHVVDHSPVRDVSIEQIVRALGAKHVEKIDPYDLTASIRAFERARDSEGVSVVIAERACPVYLAHVAPPARQPTPQRGQHVTEPAKSYEVDPSSCQSCGRAKYGMRCDVPLTRGYERHMARSRSLEQARIEERPEVAPCSAKCPLFLCVQGYAGHVAAGEYGEALAHIVGRVSLPESVCRVCHRPCETACVRGSVDLPVAINDVKRFVVEWALAKKIPYEPAREADNGRNIAVIGAGPSGLAAAHDLRLRGYAVTLFDANESPGGLLRTGIPRFRLPRAALERDIARVLSMGIEFVGKKRLGRDLRLDGLLSKYDAVYVALGASRALTLGLEGQGDIRTGLAYLEDVELGRAPATGQRVVVVGGGNAAIDVARTARRSGASEVTIACIEAREEMPALAAEIREAEDEGIALCTGLRPVRVLSGERAGLEFSGGEIVDADQILVCIGQATGDFTSDRDIDLERTPDGCVQIDPETCRTSNARVFAGGDVVSGERSVTAAMAWGQRAAWGIDRQLRGSAADRRAPPPRPGSVPLGPSSWAPRADRTARRRARHLSIDERIAGFGEVTGTMTDEDARAEAARCMSCGLCGNCRSCIDLFGCPAFFLESATDAGKSRVRIDPELCIRCAVCEKLCPDGAIGEGASS